VQLVLYPGAVSAGGTITIPSYFPPIWRLLRFVVKRMNTITWSGLGAAGATIATKDVSAAASGSDSIAECAEKTVVTTTPGTGQVQLTGPRKITVGDAINDGDTVIIDAIPVTAYPAPS